ncbi:MAG: HNH endonuclease [Chloracidobacterium sp.]|nr:HNH endonuclease [Chloracidobacterium sp.]
MTRTHKDEFSKATKLSAWHRCGGFCECGCGQKIISGNVEYDHRLPVALGGDSSVGNCVVLRTRCHLTKTVGFDRPAIDKAVRVKEKNAGLRKPRGRPYAGHEGERAPQTNGRER